MSLPIFFAMEAALQKVDFIIVGQGLAGSALAMALLKRGKSILVVDRADSDAATRVAAGLVTPLAGKGMNPAWRQAEYLPKSLEYYRALEARCGEQLYYPHPVVRLFANEKEAAKFQRKKEQVQDWVLDEVASVDEDTVHAEHGGFVMKHGGRLDTNAYLAAVRSEVEAAGVYLQADFDEVELEFAEDRVQWKNFSAERVILCQGFSGLREGHFAWVPSRCAKGEMLTVQVEGLAEDSIFSRNGWMVPLGDQKWRAGATYEWDNLETIPTEEGCRNVLEKVAEFTSCQTALVKHDVGVRPIVFRSQPVVGVDPEQPQLGFFNGLGSKGVITAPCVGEHFAAHLCGECELDTELALARFIES